MTISSERKKVPMAVMVIEPTLTCENPLQPQSAQPQRTRVAAYCRVSTDSEEQEASYEAQCSHYAAFISENTNWQLAGIYADAGITGTSAKRREQFLRMIADCEAGAIDLVITKSISRFARNTLDCLRYIRMLKALGVAVFFEKENINTLDAKGEVLITIMASIAQQESQSLSQNVRMGIQYRMQEGKGPLNTAFFLGYTRDARTGKLVPVPREADVVRRIYREYLEGFSPAGIARRLQAAAIPAPKGGSVWYASTVSSILKNEKYCGDLLLQKYYTADFLTRKIVRNTGQLPRYFVEDDHAPIVPKEVFSLVQDEIAYRSLLKGDLDRTCSATGPVFAGKLVCGICGRTLKRYTTPCGAVGAGGCEGGIGEAPGSQSIDWRCRERARAKRSPTREIPGACPCPIVADEQAKQVVLAALNALPALYGELVAKLRCIEEERRLMSGGEANAHAMNPEIYRESLRCCQSVDLTEASPGTLGSSQSAGSSEVGGEAAGGSNLACGPETGKEPTGFGRVAGGPETGKEPTVATRAAGASGAGKGAAGTSHLAGASGAGKGATGGNQATAKVESARQKTHLRFLLQLVEAMRSRASSSTAVYEPASERILAPDDAGVSPRFRLPSTSTNSQPSPSASANSLAPPSANANGQLPFSASAGGPVPASASAGGLAAWCAAASCVEAEDFFARTAPDFDVTLNSLGNAVRFHDDLVNRYINQITVYPDLLEVHFKIGVSVQVPLS